MYIIDLDAHIERERNIEHCGEYPISKGSGKLFFDTEDKEIIELTGFIIVIHGTNNVYLTSNFGYSRDLLEARIFDSNEDASKWLKLPKLQDKIVTIEEATLKRDVK